MDFGEVLSRAWQIIWKHKILWLFGILAGCSGGGGNGGGSGNVSYQGDSMPRGMENFFNNLQDWQIALMVAAVILVVLILVVLAIFLSTIGRVALIRGAKMGDEGAERLTFVELFNGSFPYFWRVFLLNLLVGLAIFAVVMVFIAFGAVLAVATFGIAMLCLIPLICIFVPIGWAVGVVIEQATIAIVIEDLGIMDGLRRGWDVVSKNIGNYIVMALILGVGAAIIGFLLAMPFFLIGLPALIGMTSGGDVFGPGTIISLICAVVYLPVLLVLGGALSSYVYTAWTLTFMRLTTPKPAMPVFASPSMPDDEPPAGVETI